MGGGAILSAHLALKSAKDSLHQSLVKKGSTGAVFDNIHPASILVYWQPGNLPIARFDTKEGKRLLDDTRSTSYLAVCLQIGMSSFCWFSNYHFHKLLTSNSTNATNQV